MNSEIKKSEGELCRNVEHDKIFKDWLKKHNCTVDNFLTIMKRIQLKLPLDLQKFDFIQNIFKVINDAREIQVRFDNFDRYPRGGVYVKDGD